ncbi:MAG: hypothetical protein GF355_07645 [Candidatus Eisenbacteria bacterium]|nr:hypothetical protein [Candidatus Eisenbacteria bacterium]
MIKSYRSREVRPRLWSGMLLWSFWLLGVAAATAQDPDPAASGAPSGPRTVTLDQALELAHEHSPLLQQARAELQTSRAAVRTAYGAFLPSLSGGSSYSRASRQRYDPNTDRTVSAGSSESYSTSLSSSLDLFNGGRRLADLRGAKASRAAAKYALAGERADLELSVKQAFFTALSAQDLVRVERERLERAETQLSFSSEQVRYGTATVSDSLRAVLEVRNAEMALVQAQQDREVARMELARVIGLAGPLAVTAEDLPEPRDVRLDTEGILVETLAQAPSVRESRARLESSEASYTASKSGYFPSLDASYSMRWSGDQPILEEEGRNRTWSIRLGLSYAIFNGFRREENVARSRANLVSARASLRQAELSVMTDMTEALGNLEAARFAIISGEQAVVVAEEDLRVQQERYSSGVSTLLDVLTSQVALDEARVNLIRARFDFRVALARIESLLGRTIEEES